MSKSYRQEPWQNSTAAVLKTLLRHIDYAAPETEADPEANSGHKRFETMVVMELLSRWGFTISSYIIALDQLPETPMPHLTFINESIQGKEINWPVLLLQSKDDQVVYIHPVDGPIHEDVVDFSQKWNNVVIRISRPETTTP